MTTEDHLNFTDLIRTILTSIRKKYKSFLPFNRVETWRSHFGWDILQRWKFDFRIVPNFDLWIYTLNSFTWEKAIHGKVYPRQCLPGTIPWTDELHRSDRKSMGVNPEKIYLDGWYWIRGSEQTFGEVCLTVIHRNTRTHSMADRERILRVCSIKVRKSYIIPCIFKLEILGHI